jgi:hypothetical protein
MEGDDALSCVVSELRSELSALAEMNTSDGPAPLSPGSLGTIRSALMDAHVNWLSNHQFSVQLHSRYFRMAQEMFTDGLIGALACVRHAPTPWATDLCVQMRTTWPN